MTVYVNTFFERRVEQLFDLAQRVEAAFAAAGLEYRLVGGLATYLYVEEAEPDAGRLTRDIDIAVRRADLDKIAAAVEPFELRYRHVAGVDMLVQTGEPTRGAPFTWYSPAKKYARSIQNRYRNSVPAHESKAFASSRSPILSG